MRKKRFLLYVVMDMSQSMSWNDETGKAKIRTAMEILPGVIETAKKSATVSSALRVSIVGFNQGAAELFLPNESIERHDVRSLERWWESTKESVFKKCSGQTYFSMMFKKLNEIIRRDQEKYDNSKFQLYRPVVYLLTDGKPEGQFETQEAIQKSLTLLQSEQGGRKPPAILSIGIGDDVNQDNIQEYAAGRTVMRWRYDKEKDRNLPEFSDGEYKRGNKAMAFIFKGDKAPYKLRTLNDAVLQSIVKSIQQVEEYSNSNGLQNAGAEPTFSVGFEPLFVDDERI